MRQLVFVHGRAQENKDAIALKAEWIDTFREGLRKSSLTLPIPETDIRFPYYGDTLYELVAGSSPHDAAPVIVRGDNVNDDEKRFARAIMEEMRLKLGVTDAELMEVSGQVVVQKGPLNWEWFQGFLRAVDRFVPFGSGAAIALFTHDVYQYLKDSLVREEIDNGVSAAITPGVETIVVSHSLGTVVAYNLLRQEGHLRGWNVPLLVTLGSPLAVTEVRETLRTFAVIRCPQCVSRWFNAMDERDVVALYPLDASSFPLDPTRPEIENKRDVRNKTSNRHGIAGYLDDAEVAKRIYDALTAK